MFLRKRRRFKKETNRVKAIQNLDKTDDFAGFVIFIILLIVFESFVKIEASSLWRILAFFIFCTAAVSRLCYSNLSSPRIYFEITSLRIYVYITYFDISEFGLAVLSFLIAVSPFVAGLPL